MLENPALSYERKHPIVIPASFWFFKVYVNYLHVKYFHANKLFLLSNIRSKLWPVGCVNRLIKKVVYSCNVCARYKSKTYSSIMGPLPASRTELNRPFSTVKVDFCGPFEVVCTGHRSIKANKAYMAVFVCPAVKAIHIEVISDVSTSKFIACLRRFFGHRGKSKMVYSDNATNFVGTNNLLLKGESELMNFVAEKGIEWKFIPPRAPHFGGIWEAAVKSLKHHLVRVSHEFKFTLEELSTLTI